MNTIETENCVFNYFPQQILDQFPRIQMISLISVELLELHQPWRNCGQLFTIHIGGNRLQRIPGRIFEACTQVIVATIRYESNLREIDDMAFAGMQSLVSLTLEELPAFSELRPGIFQQIPILDWFIMIATNVEELPSNVFRPLRFLRVVELRNNQLTTIQTEAFNELPNLNFVIITGNSRLSNIHPEAFKGLLSLEFLSLENANLTELRTSSFTALPSLHTFDIRSNGLAKIERNFFDNLPNLQLLIATGNECVNYLINDISNQRVEFYQTLEECFARFDTITTTSTLPPTTETTSTTTLGATSITLSFGLILSCILIIKFSW